MRTAPRVSSVSKASTVNVLPRSESAKIASSGIEISPASGTSSNVNPVGSETSTGGSLTPATVTVTVAVAVVLPSLMV